MNSLSCSVAVPVIGDNFYSLWYNDGSKICTLRLNVIDH